MADYIPARDPEFNLFQDSFMKIIVSSFAAWGIPEADVKVLQANQAVWNEAFGKASNKQDRTSPDVQAKDDAATVYKKALRQFVGQWITYNTKIPDSERERMGLTIRSDVRTPKPVPETCPEGSIDFATRLQHDIYFVDENAGRSKAKPDGVHGCEIWAKIGGDLPKSVSEMQYLTTATRSPYTQTFETESAGQTVYYWLRWVNTRNQAGPWGNPVKCMVVG
jgi:hypothetical protein